MKPSRRPTSVSRLLPLVALAAVFLSGCITTTEVRDIVRASNYEMLVAADPALATTVPADADKGPKPAASAAARLTDFLQANPDDPVLGPALHLRQALLYLNQRQFDLADAAFKGAEGAKFTTPRDQALATAYPDIKWWTQWSLSAGGAFRAERADAQAHMDALENLARGDLLKPCPDVRDYFLEMRAWIGLKAAFAVVLPADAAFQDDMLAHAINPWTDTFAAGDLALVGNPAIDEHQAFTLATRRALRLRTFLDRLADTVRSGGNDLPRPTIRFNAPEAQAYYLSKLNAPH